jgi:hypothetical protein
MGDYIPSAPVDEEAQKRNGNLPGMGGVYNYVNMHVYHYAGNNPVKLVDPDGEANLPVQTKYLMNAVYSIWGNEIIRGTTNTLIRDGGCAITGVANIIVTLGFLQSQNPRDVNRLPGIVANGAVQWTTNPALSNFVLTKVSRTDGRFTHAIYNQQENDYSREYATLVKVQYEATGNDHWVGVKGIDTEGGQDYIIIAPTSKNDYNVGPNTVRYGQGWIQKNGNILVPVERTSAYVTFSRSLVD